jgi:hypothetical protein
MIKGCLNAIGVIILLGILAAFIVPKFFPPHSSPSGVSQSQPAIDPAQIAAERAQQQTETLEAQKRGNIALKSLNIQHDKVQDVRWYGTPTWKSGHIGVFLYFGKNNQSAPDLHLVFQYHDDRWIFARKVLIKADADLLTYVPEKWRRDHNTEVWEVADSDVGLVEMAIIRHMLKAKKIILRFEGDEHIRDYTIPDSMRNDLQKVLDAYVAMGGSLT